MKRLKRFIMRSYENGDAFWLVMMVSCIVFALAAPWYFGWVGAIAAVFYYDMAMELRITTEVSGTEKRSFYGSA